MEPGWGADPRPLCLGWSSLAGGYNQDLQGPHLQERGGGIPPPPRTSAGKGEAGGGQAGRRARLRLEAEWRSWRLGAHVEGRAPACLPTPPADCRTCQPSARARRCLPLRSASGEQSTAAVPRGCTCKGAGLCVEKWGTHKARPGAPAEPGSVEPLPGACSCHTPGCEQPSPEPHEATVCVCRVLASEGQGVASECPPVLRAP